MSKKPISHDAKQIPPPEKTRRIRVFVKSNGFFAQIGQNFIRYYPQRPAERDSLQRVTDEWIFFTILVTNMLTSHIEPVMMYL